MQMERSRKLPNLELESWADVLLRFSAGRFRAGKPRNNSRRNLLAIAGITQAFLTVSMEDMPADEVTHRLSRIITTLLLLRAGYSYVPYSSMETIIEANKDNYYLALRRTQQTIRTDKQNWEYWLVFFLRTLAKQKGNLAIKVNEEQALRSSLPALSRQILELVKTRGEITVKEIQSSTGANRNTIKLHLKKLVGDNYLARVGQGRGVRYTLK
jgi:hypothetical protein